MDPRTGDLLRLLAAVSARRREDVSLSAMAGLAHRSRFDLHRRVRRLIGETPKALTADVSIDVQITDLSQTHALVMRHRVTQDRIAGALAECIPAAGFRR